MSTDRGYAREVLGGARIVATLPLASEHLTLHLRMALQQIEALKACGAEVFPFDVSYSQTGDSRALFAQVTALAAFKPQLVVTTAGPTQVFRCRTGRITMADGWFVPNNLFVDNLGLPTILLWDTMMEMVAGLRAGSLVVGESRAGVLERARDQINNPLYFHLAFDQQHVNALRKLGVLTTPHVRSQIAWAMPNYRYPSAEPIAQDRDIMYAGNLFKPTPAGADDRTLDVLARFRNAVCARLAGDITASYWDAVEQALGEIDPADAEAARLGYDHSFFWSFLASDVMARVITNGRLAALRAVRHPVDFYGLLHNPELASLLEGSTTTYRGVADFDAELPALFARTKVTLDVVTTYFPTGVTTKIVNCLAAGGLCLFNAKAAFRDAFGSEADGVMYRDFDDMRAKLDHLLTHDRERRELAAHLRRQVEERLTWVATVARMVAWVRESRAF
jgi:hypothetical protein